MFKDQIIFRSRDGPKKNINWPLIYSFSPQNSAIKQTLPEKSQKKYKFLTYDGKLVFKRLGVERPNKFYECIIFSEILLKYKSWGILIGSLLKLIKLL